jgi:hypothetical protein
MLHIQMYVYPRVFARKLVTEISICVSFEINLGIGKCCYISARTDMFIEKCLHQESCSVPV